MFPKRPWSTSGSRRAGSTAQAEWESGLEAYAEEYPDLAAEFQRVMHRQLPDGWDADLPTFAPADGPMATRIASGKMIALRALVCPS